MTTNTRRLLLQGMVTHAYDLGRGPTVICLHGNAGFADDFFPTAQTLAARYHVWLVDRPGHGASECPSAPLSWEDHVAWLRALVHTVATGDTLLVAHSWSGALALAYGLQCPTDLTGLVLLAPLAMPLAPTATDRFLATHFGAWLSGQPPLRWAVRRQIMLSLARAFAPAPVPPAYASCALASWSCAGSLRATAQDNLAARAALPRLVAQYSMLAVPAVVVAGDRDRLLPPSEHAERLVSLAPQITLRLLPGVGHEIPHTHPQAVRKAVDDILAHCHYLTGRRRIAVNREEMRLLTEHCAWADRTLMQALAGTPSDIWWKAVPSSYGTLFATVLHLFGTEWTWLERVNGRSPTRVGPGSIESPDRLMEAWSLVWQGWRQVVEHLDPDLEITYRTTSGKEFVSSLSNVILHVAEHSATYRGQATALQRLLHVPTVHTDLITFLRERPVAW